MGVTQQNGNYLSCDNRRQRGKSMKGRVGKQRGKAGLWHLLFTFPVLSPTNNLKVSHWLTLKVSVRTLKYFLCTKRFYSDQSQSICFALKRKVCWACLSLCAFECTASSYAAAGRVLGVIRHQSIELLLFFAQNNSVLSESVTEQKGLLFVSLYMHPPFQWVPSCYPTAANIPR